jgi:hypothetical protein
VTTRCAHCSFVVVAPLQEGHAAFVAHICDRPRPEATKRRRSGFALRSTRLPGSC